MVYMGLEFVANPDAAKVREWTRQHAGWRADWGDLGGLGGTWGKWRIRNSGHVGRQAGKWFFMKIFQKYAKYAKYAKISVGMRRATSPSSSNLHGGFLQKKPAGSPFTTPDGRLR